MQIDNLLFDLDGTLYPSTANIEHSIKPSMRKILSSYLKCSIDAAHDKLWTIIKDQRYENEAYGLDELGIPLEKFYSDVYKNLDLSKISKNDNLKKEIDRLSENYNLALMTNSSITHAERLLKYFDIYDKFDVIMGFESLNFIRKPKRQAYIKALEITNFIPDKTLYFDDSIPNLYVAYELGMNTCLVSNGLVEPPYFYELHYRMKHLPPDFVNITSYSLDEVLKTI